MRQLLPVMVASSWTSPSWAEQGVTTAWKTRPDGGEDCSRRAQVQNNARERDMLFLLLQMIATRSSSQTPFVRFVRNSHSCEDEIHTGGVEWEDVKVGTGASLMEQIGV